VIAATNADLEEMVEEGLFRKDLFYRLNVVQLQLPALRDRKSDIPLLAEHFLDYFADINNLNPTKFTNSALDAMHDYHWPGNVRELRNVCERVSILFPGKSVGAKNLPTDITTRTKDSPQTFLQLPEDGISLEFLESTYIEQALNRTRFNKAKSAKLLGISRDALVYRMNKYNIVYA
jgi:DNA-binding NtrC family response regulator